MEGGGDDICSLPRRAAATCALPLLCLLTARSGVTEMDSILIFSSVTLCWCSEWAVSVSSSSCFRLVAERISEISFGLGDEEGETVEVL